MKTKLNNLFRKLSRFVAPLALSLAILTANSTCFYLSYQPDEPAALKKMNLHDAWAKE